MNSPSDNPISPTVHVTVLADEAVEWLNVSPGAVVVDGTMGGGGHLRGLAEAAQPGGRVVGIDRDARAIDRVEQAWNGPPTRFCQANFDAIPEVLEQLEWGTADAVLLDLGLSSDQLADADRGFSFESDGPLDLRFDDDEGEPAWRLLETLTEKQIADVIYRYGEERCSRRIARRIVERRKSGEPVRTATELAHLVRRCVPPGGQIHPATRTFQALRIAVNDELGSLERTLRRLPDVVAPGGRVAIISFHSLEDRQVKQAFRDDDRYIVLTKKPIQPNEAEIARNPRSRSAKMRVAERAPV